ncbi:hypothetical protein PIB30_094112 [Stylosanthes scabra]|uniref:F-box associated beta-propeller type 1 domain-containing protein n=1 Tax=Stylosanthes scabra TaxID=79078 RepID=A0ABU6YVY6_9FABA|nr:hypothetical protein [Stylosanthes scabra]
MLWNPCTGYTSEWLHTTASITTSGFGYDHVNHKYKFFALLQLKSGAFISKIFTFGTNHWKIIENCPSHLVKRVSLRGVLVSGTLYWLVRVPHVVIVYLDLGSETYGELSLAHRDPDDDFRIIAAIGVLRNCLSLCLDHKKTHWALWLLNNQSWTKLAMIPQNSLSTGHLKL